MFESPLTRMRRRVGAVMFSVVVVGAIWMMAPGMPVLSGPSAPPSSGRLDCNCSNTIGNRTTPKLGRRAGTGL